MVIIMSSPWKFSLSDLYGMTNMLANPNLRHLFELCNLNDTSSVSVSLLIIYFNSLQVKLSNIKWQFHLLKPYSKEMLLSAQPPHNHELECHHFFGNIMNNTGFSSPLHRFIMFLQAQRVVWTSKILFLGKVLFFFQA